MPIHMEIADIPSAVDSGGGMWQINWRESPLQPNTPTLRAPFTGLNEEAGQSPALSRNGRPRLHPQPRRVRTTARRSVSAFEERRWHSRYDCNALCSFGAGRFFVVRRAHSERERASILLQSDQKGSVQYQTRTSRRNVSKAASRPRSDHDGRFASEWHGM